MKIVAALVLCLACAACVPPESDGGYASEHSQYIKAGEELIYCQSEVNIPEEILYYKSKQIVNRFDVPELAEPFESYYITDVLGEVYAINSDEINNYDCFSVEKP